jgi:hypothetical protein
MAHGFRKFFETVCINSGMNRTYVKFCMGHSLGIDDSYFLPQPDSNGVYIDILEGHDTKSPGYIDAIPSLTINEENRLRRENEMLKVKKSEIEQLKQRDKTSAAVMVTMQEQITRLQDDQAKQQKLFLAYGLRDQKLRELDYITNDEERRKRLDQLIKDGIFADLEGYYDEYMKKMEKKRQRLDPVSYKPDE